MQVMSKKQREMSKIKAKFKYEVSKIRMKYHNEHKLTQMGIKCLRISMIIMK